MGTGPADRDKSIGCFLMKGVHRSEKLRYRTCQSG
ncbi:hypothetical protein CCACVL1_14212 [Corchorus capsularis]|uniref:Uncharacterized protein n=1 Tax=Corchorus capsularis TaxID=210143 RepID=A0A1R3I830_COCAP|nr:hypothetical protein CCACVL1_14212 [Corchorus capsularis]